MRRYVTFALAGLVMLALLPCTGVAAAEQRKPVPMYSYLMKNDADFAATEKMYEKESAAFLAKFDASALPLAQQFLSILDPLPRKEDKDMYLEAQGGSGFRKQLANSRALTIRFMQLFNRQQAFSSSWLALVRSVLLPPPVMSDLRPKEIAALLDAVEKNALPRSDRIVIRTVGKEKQAALLNRDIRLSRSLPYLAENIAAVVRLNKGKIAALLVPTLVEKDFYPTSALGGVWERTPQTPDGVQLHTGTLVVRPVISNAEGPFAFTVYTAPAWYSDTPTKIQVSEVASFPFTLVKGVYTRGEPVRRGEGEWGTFHPYDGWVLIPIREYCKKLWAEDEALRRDLTEARKVWSEFLALFDGDTLKRINGNRGAWQFFEDKRLLPLIDKPEAFATRWREEEQAMARYAAKVLELAKKPDARLLLLLEPSLVLPLDKDKIKKAHGWTVRNSYISSLLRAVQIVESGEYVMPPRSLQGYTLTTKGLKGGNKITVTVEGFEKFPYSESVEYVLRAGSDVEYEGSIIQKITLKGKPYYGEAIGVVCKNGKIYAVF